MPDPVATPPPAAPPAASPPASTPPPAAPPPAAPPAAPPSPPPSDDPIKAFDAKLASAFDKDMGKPPAAPAGTPPAGTPPAAPGTPPKPATPPAGAPRQPKELRAELDRVNTELTTKAKQVSDMEAKIADFERRGKDTEALTGRLKTLEQQLDAIQAENRMLKQESSPEFKAKYEKPFNDAAAYAEKVVKTLEVSTETGQSRAATFEDFLEVYNQPTFNKSVKRANELFGEASQVVINHVTELQRLEYQRNMALQEERANAKSRQEAEIATRAKEKEDVAKLWENVNKDLSESVEDYKDQDPTDKELATVRNEGYQIFDEKPKTLQERILRNAHIRHRFAAFGPLKLRLLREMKKNADLQKELDTYKTSVPDPNRRPGGAAGGAPDEDWEAGARRELNK